MGLFCVRNLLRVEVCTKPGVMQSALLCMVEGLLQYKSGLQFLGFAFERFYSGALRAFNWESLALPN